ncbi:MAG: hypothetical protein NUV45_06420 [Tepidanaerobacteraceae bacterium]|nr:hypothetical protein [Tepidanaerobacteraceae bacterium]
MKAHDLFVVGQQRLPYEYSDDIKEIASRFSEHIGLMAVFSYGVILGKRMERAKRKTPKSKETQS